MLICSTFVSNDPLAQLVERGANNGKVDGKRIKELKSENDDIPNFANSVFTPVSFTVSGLLFRIFCFI